MGASSGGAGGGKKSRNTGPRVAIDWSRGLASLAVDSTMTNDDVIGVDNARSLLTKEENDHNQPFVIYLTDDSKDAKKTQNVLDGAFLDERIGIAAQVFCMLKAPGKDIDKDHPFARHIPGDVLPRVAVFAGDGTKIGQLDGAATPVDIYKLMGEAFQVSYRADMKQLQDDYRKLLTKMDMLRDKKSLLDDRYLTCETRAKELALEKKITKLEKEAKKLEERKEKLIALERRWQG